MKTEMLAAFSAALLMVSACGGGNEYEYPFRDPSLPVEERVENLLSLLTPEEKVGLMMNKSVSVDRLGIPAYNWWSEACHGIRADGYTVYPQYIGLAATFNPDLVYDVFSSVSDEARANWNRSTPEFNVGMRARYYPGNPELSFWCPNINIFRDPRWGRGQETPGEDPYLTEIIGVQTVRGMQGDDDRYFKTHACAKHYGVHSGPEPLRHRFDVSVSPRDLWETYLPAFKALVTEANVQEVMCAYHRYEGVPCCASDRLLQNILRDKWGYKSLVVTDCDAINNFYTPGQHETHPDAMHASADAVLNGTDLECGNSFTSLLDALKQGLIKESDLDLHLRRTLRSRFELGMFDPAGMLPWSNLGSEVISSEEHDAQAVQAAAESMVLLKNDGVLPLSRKVRKVAALGPNADNVQMLNGNYGGTPTAEHARSILAGIRKALPDAEIVYDPACDYVDEYNTENLLPKFNGGKGLKTQFYGGKSLSGKALKEEYRNGEINFSTFGAYGFSEGVDADGVAVRLSGEFKSDFDGQFQYNISSDNGYTLKVNGRTVEKAGNAARRGFGFRNTVPDYKSIPVKKGENYVIEVEYVRGDGPFAMLSVQFCRRELADFRGLASRVADADAIIVVGGITASFEGEGGDRPDIELPNVQRRLLQAMHATGRPVIFVNCSGSAMGFEGVEDSYDALIQAWYGGQGGADALAGIMLGDFNPSAKLPVTFYTSTAQLPDFQDYSMEGRTYRYFRGEPMYPFGFGLSYTSFEYGQGRLSATAAKPDKKLTLTVPVTNIGSVDGEEVVQVYVKSLDRADAPLKSLKAFKKVKVAAGKTVKVRLVLDNEAFHFYDGNDGLAPSPGRYEILYGSSSADRDLKSLDFTLL